MAEYPLHIFRQEQSQDFLISSHRVWPLCLSKLNIAFLMIDDDYL